MAAVTEARQREVTTVRERVRSILDAFAGAMLSDGRRARIAYLEVPGTSRRLEKRAREVVRQFAAMVEEEARMGAAGGVLPDRDYELTARLLVGGTTSILLDWLADRGRRPLEEVLDELTSAFVLLLEQPPR
jgi:AcrR family transcriptional regulator